MNEKIPELPSSLLSSADKGKFIVGEQKENVTTVVQGNRHKKIAIPISQIILIELDKMSLHLYKPNNLDVGTWKSITIKISNDIHNQLLTNL